MKETEIETHIKRSETRLDTTNEIQSTTENGPWGLKKKSEYDTLMSIIPHCDHITSTINANYFYILHGAPKPHRCMQELTSNASRG